MTPEEVIMERIHDAGQEADIETILEWCARSLEWLAENPSTTELLCIIARKVLSYEHQNYFSQPTGIIAGESSSTGST